MRAGPQLGVAKAARAPPCTLPILGRRFYSNDNNLLFLFEKNYVKAFSNSLFLKKDCLNIHSIEIHSYRCKKIGLFGIIFGF